jgi:hypothetical protein
MIAQEQPVMDVVTGRHFADVQPDVMNPLETIENMIAAVEQQAKAATDVLYKAQAGLQDAEIRKRRWDVLLEALRIALNDMEVPELHVPTRPLETTVGEQHNGRP